MRRNREMVLAQRTAMKKKPSRGADFVVAGYSRAELAAMAVEAPED
jgi:hypothetical protein